MSEQVDVFVDTDDLDDASSGFLFVVPADAVTRGKLNDPLDEKARAEWVQSLEITSSKVYEEQVEDKKNGGKYPAVTFELDFTVPASSMRTDGSADPNAGKAHREWYRFIPSARKNKQHPLYKRHNFALGKLHSILRSVFGSDVVPHGANVNLSDFYGAPNGQTPAVVGQAVVANVRQSTYEGRKRDELTDFVAKELQSV